MSIFKKFFIMFISIISVFSLYACKIQIETLKDVLIENTKYEFTKPDKDRLKITKPFKIKNSILEEGKYQGKSISVIYQLKDKTNEKYFQIVGSRVNVLQPDDGRDRIISIVAKITFDNTNSFEYELRFKVLPVQGDFYTISLPAEVKITTPGINPEQVRQNTEVEFEVTVPKGKEISAFKINGSDWTDALIDNKLRYTVSENIAISVEFKENSTDPEDTEYEVVYDSANLTLKSGELNAENKAQKGAELEFEIKQIPDKTFEKLIINEEDRTNLVKANKFTIKVNKKTTLEVIYKNDGANPEQEDYLVNYNSAHLNLIAGTIDAGNKAKKGAMLEFEIKKQPDKTFKKLTINGKDRTHLVENNKFKLTVNQATNIEVEYKNAETYDVTFQNSELSLLSGNVNNNKAEKGTLLKFAVKAKSGFRVKSLLINGQNKTALIKADNTFEIQVKGNLTLTVEYEKTTEPEAKHDGFRRANTAILSENAKKYYQGINFNTENPTELLRQLRELTVRKHTNVVNYKYAKKLGEIDKLDNGKAWSIYDSIEYSTSWGNKGIPWNREHVWPNSYMGTQDHAGDSSKGIDSDLHNLRVLTNNLNSKRNNSYYRDGSGTGDGNATWFYPGDAHIGDVSRIIAYMLVRYDWLKVTNEKPGKNAYFKNNDGSEIEGKKRAKIGDVRNFIKFHTKDPVTVFEQNRNERIARIQGNRNPFIDFPQFTEIIFRHYMALANISLLNQTIEKQIDFFISSIHRIQQNYFSQSKQTVFA